MVILKAYLDDSGDDIDPQHKACSLFGYLGHVEQWEQFESEWRAALDEYGMPYLHMRDFIGSKQPYERFRHDEPGRVAFLQSLGKVIQRSRLEGVGSVVRLADLRRFCSETGASIDAYALNLYACLVWLGLDWPDVGMEIILDKAPKVNRKIELARAYLDTDPHRSGSDHAIEVSGLHKTKSFKTVLPIQAADFIAHETRKDVTTKDDLFGRASTMGGRGWIEAQRKWAAERGHSSPYPRKSLDMLVNLSVFVSGPVWDYERLTKVSAYRAGKWPTLG